MRRSKYPNERRGDYLDLTDEGHDIWMHENNPDGWSDATWRAFVARCANPEFLARSREAKRNGWKRPHPTEDGWEPPPNFNPIDALVRSRRLRRVK